MKGEFHDHLSKPYLGASSNEVMLKKIACNVSPKRALASLKRVLKHMSSIENFDAFDSFPSFYSRSTSSQLLFTRRFLS